MDLRTLTPNGATRLADFLAGRALIAFALIHLLAFIAFAVTLAGAGKALSAQFGTCAGENLVEKLRRDDPERLASAMAEAAATENGSSVFWKIEKPGLEPSWLLGTMHSADPRIARLSPAARSAFDAASTVIIESTEALDPERIKATMVAQKDLTFLTDGSTLDAMVPESAIDELRSAVEARDMPWVLARHMQPWLVAATISIPVCEVEAKRAGAPVLDSLIGRMAHEANKRLVGLETVAEQFLAVASIPHEFHVNALNETLKLGPLADSMMTTTKELYLEGNTALLLPMVRAFAPQTYAGKGYAEFQELLIAGRNRTMAERAAGHLSRGNAFMAVGALHLPGEQGLVALLRRQGFAVEPAGD